MAEGPPATPSRGASPPPAKKQRKQRATLSCAECRRLKLKCDRQIPCSNCQRRNCVDLCPDGTRPVRSTGESTELRERLELLERLLSNNGIVLPDPSAEASSTAPSRRRKSSSPSLEESEPPEAPDVAIPDPAASRPEPRSANAMPDPPRSRRRPPPPSPSRSATRSVPPPAPARRTPDADRQAPPLATPRSVVSVLSGPGPSPQFNPPIPAADFGSVHFDFGDPPAGPSAGSFGNPLLPAGAASMDQQSFGTLVMTSSGRSKYLGPTAASEWLMDQEVHDTSPSQSRAASPRARAAQRQPPPEGLGDSVATTFPFGGSIEPVTTTYLVSKLPPLGEGCVFVDSYYRYFAWHFDISPRESFQPIFDRVYKQMVPSGGTLGDVSLHELALVFITMALGALHNLELNPNDPIADDFFTLAKAALGKGTFLSVNTLAAVQTIHIMAHFCLETERGRNGDSAWPLWGLAMRIIQAMGLHRDPGRWDLSPAVCEERRRVFWECHAADIFQANCFSRPNAISPDYIDVTFPTEMMYSSKDGSKGFATLKFELCRIAGSWVCFCGSQLTRRVLDHAMKVHATPYSTVMGLHDRLISFEKDVPFYLRCRAALCAMTSRYPDIESAIHDSPEENKRDLHRTFQQFTLFLNITEAIVFLHRPYYVRALAEGFADPMRSIYGQSYLTIVERTNVIIQLVTRIHSLHPNVVSRHWYFWYHAFNAAVCIGTLIIKTPANPLAGFALAQIDACIGVYTAAVQGRASRRMVTNLQWLLKLRQRAAGRMAQAAAAAPAGAGDKGDAGPATGAGASATGGGVEGEDSDEDVELVGWRTRLIQRAARGTQTATTISLQSQSPVNSVSSTSPNTAVAQTITHALQQHFAPELGTGTGQSPLDGSATDALMTQFWDPMLLQDMPDLMGNINSFTLGWDWDSTM